MVRGVWANSPTPTHQPRPTWHANSASMCQDSCKLHWTMIHACGRVAKLPHVWALVFSFFYIACTYAWVWYCHHSDYGEQSSMIQVEFLMNDFLPVYTSLSTIDTHLSGQMGNGRFCFHVRIFLAMIKKFLNNFELP